MAAYTLTEVSASFAITGRDAVLQRNRYLAAVAAQLKTDATRSVGVMLPPVIGIKMGWRLADGTYNVYLPD